MLSFLPAVRLQISSFSFDVLLGNSLSLYWLVGMRFDCCCVWWLLSWMSVFLGLQLPNRRRQVIELLMVTEQFKTQVCPSVCPSYRLGASCLKFRTVSTKFLKALNSATTPWMAPTEAAWPIWPTWARPTSVKEKTGCFQPWWGELRSEILFIACVCETRFEMFASVDTGRAG